jgi:hypothetical protein
VDADRPAEVRFSDDPGFDFAVRCVLSGIGARLADAGEVLATAASVPPGDVDAWFDAWSSLADRCSATGRRAADGGHHVSAARAHLRAANYRFCGWYYVLATREPMRRDAAWRAHRADLDAAFAHWPTPVEPFEVPWPGGPLHAWRFRPAADRPARGTVVLHNGLGSPMSDVMMTGAPDAVDRGWDCVVFDGPGQGVARFVDGLGPVADWGAVGVAVLDAALALDGASPGPVVAEGVSDGGYLAALHAAVDDRVSALVCDPGVVRPLDGVLGALPAELATAWREGGASRVDSAVAAAGGRPDGVPVDVLPGGADGVAFAAAKAVEQWPGHTLGTVLDELARWDLTGHLDAIRVPVVICDPEAAVSFPGQSAELAAAVGDLATVLRFTAAEGAGLDCEILAPELRNQRVHDALADLLPVGI